MKKGKRTRRARTYKGNLDGDKKETIKEIPVFCFEAQKKGGREKTTPVFKYNCEFLTNS